MKKQKTKVFALFLVVFMLVTGILGATTAFATSADNEASAVSDDGIATVAASTACYKNSSHSTSNGFCTTSSCGGYMACEKNSSGYYEIGNGGQLYWFAGLVNGTLSGVSQNKSANAVLTANITVNSNVLSSSGTLNSGSYRAWTPIANNSSNNYTGTFDGKGHTISGLYYNGTEYNVGLFGMIGDNAVVKNVGVLDSYIYAGAYAGSIVGYTYGNTYTTIENCYSNARIETKYGCVGGILGHIHYNADVKNCYFYGTVVCGSDSIGPIFGYGGYGNVVNCYYRSGITNAPTEVAKLDTCEVTSKSSSQFSSGEVTWLLNGSNNSKAASGVWKQTIGSSSYPGYTGSAVYTKNCNSTTGNGYTNGAVTHVDSGNYDSNGFCNNANCDGYQPATKNNSGYYEISNIGKLLWFAQQVNAGNTSYNAVLTNNINLTGRTDWYYMDTYYGTFNGQGYSIIGMNTDAEGNRCVNNEKAYGFIRYLYGTVKNVTFDSAWVDTQSDKGNGIIAYQNYGTISSCMVENSYATLGNYGGLGFIAGLNQSGGVIENCGAVNSILERRYGGTYSHTMGFITQVNNGTIRNCFSYGCEFLYGTSANGALIAEGNAPTNSYYYTTSTTVSTYGTAKTAEEFASGEVAYLLNGSSSSGVWKQTIGTADSPSLAGNTVYAYTYCTGETLYTNDSSMSGKIITHSFDEDGFCTNEGCGGYQPATLNGTTGFYEISNAGQLFWFAQQVNAGKCTYKGKLMNDIDLENRVWTPIGNSTEIDGENKGVCFAGSFDGNGKTISGLNVQANKWNSGLFGAVASGATIKNMTVEGNITITASGIGNIGLIGFGRDIYVQDIISKVNISFADGLSTITNPTAMRNIGGIMGYDFSQVRMARCAYYGTIDLGAHAAQYVGGFIGYINNDTNASYYIDYIENCGFYGTIKGSSTSAKYISGFVGYCDLSRFAIRNSLFAGALNVSSTNYVTAFGTYNRIYTSTSYTHNLYYVANDSLTAAAGSYGTSSPLSSAIHAVSEEAMKSGEIAYLLNNSSSAGAVWKQTIGTDTYPTFTGNVVYKVVNGGCTDATYSWIYSNTNTNTYTHFYTAGLCGFVQDASAKYIVNVMCPCGSTKIATFTVYNPTKLISDGTSHDVMVKAWYADGIENFAIDASQKIYTYSETLDGDFVETTDLTKAGYYKVFVTVRDNPNARATNAIAEFNYQVKKASVTYIYNEYDGSSLGSETGYIYDTAVTYKPTGISGLDKINDYYKYTFKHWLGEDGTVYTTLPDFNSFYADNTDVTVTFKAVYDITYNKEFHLNGDIGNDLIHSNIYDKDVLIVDKGGYVSVITNFGIQTNGGVASLLLIPNYDKTKFQITGIAVNGELVWGTGATSEVVLSGWEATVTGTEVEAALTKIVLEQTPASTQTGDNFIQIIYTSKEAAVTGEYEFGFVTMDYAITTEDKLTHNDRSEAYGVVSSDPLASFNELKITVTNAKVTVIVREDATITVTKPNIIFNNQNAIVVGDHATGVLPTDNTFQYHFSGHELDLIGGIDHDWLQYVTMKWYDKDGNLIGDGKTAPTDAGFYYLGLSVLQTAHFNAIEEQLFLVEIKPYTIGVEATVKNPDKTYNGKDQVWVPGDLTITNTIPALSGIGYTVTLENATHMNAGKYTVIAVFTADKNYIFGTDEDGNYLTEYRITEGLEVVMNKYKLTITLNELSSVYGEALKQLTVTFSATGTTADANREITFVRDDYDTDRLLLTLVKADGLDVGEYALSVASYTDVYSNYDITINDVHKYYITPMIVQLPTIEDLVYNGAEQSPAAPAGITFVHPETGETVTIYTWEGTAQVNAGSYKWNATLTSLDNFKWADETGNTPTALREIDWKITPAKITVAIGNYNTVYGEDFPEIVYTLTAGQLFGSDELGTIGLNYYIVFIQKTPATDESGNPILDENGNQLYYEVGVDAEIDERGKYPVGTYILVGLDESQNYEITYELGTYEITKKILDESTLAQIIAMITGATKEYTGSELEWLLEDFVLSGEINGVPITDIIEILQIDGIAKKPNDQENAFINANGKLTEDGWVYYTVEANGYANKLYYVVSIKIVDEALDSYVLYMGTDDEGNATEVTADDVDIEVFIKQAANKWTTSPSVTGSNAETLVETSTALFGNPASITYYEDKACTIPVDRANIHAGITYYAKFVINEHNNYAGLSTVLEFNTTYLTTLIPNAYVDGNHTLIVPVNGSWAIDYNGLAHFLEIANGEYTLVFSTPYESWINAGGTYIVTLKLNQDYSWNGVVDNEETEADERVADITFTLVINKVSLTITADDKNVIYRDPTPSYSATVEGWVNGEDFGSYDSSFDITNYLYSAYESGVTGVGEYLNYILFNMTEEQFEAFLTNYDVTLVSGNLTVSKLTLELENMTGKLDNDDATVKFWKELLAKGFSVEYNAQLHVVTVDALPAELTVLSIVYTNANGDVVDPKNAGTYTVTVTLGIADGYDEGNFEWTNPDPVTLTITKVVLKAETAKQEGTYTGDKVDLPITSIEEAIANGLFSFTFNDGREGNPMEIEFIAGEVTLNYLYLRTDAAYGYIINQIYDDAVYVDITFTNNFEIVYVNGDFEIIKNVLEWLEDLWANDRDYNGDILIEGTDFGATVDGGTKPVEYWFFSSPDADNKLDYIPINAGTYYIMAYYDDGINEPMYSDYVEITISKLGIVVSVDKDTLWYYLQDIDLNAYAEDYAVLVEYLVNGEWTTEQPGPVGTYDVRVSVSGYDTDNYKLVTVTDEENGTTEDIEEFLTTTVKIDPAQISFEYKETEEETGETWFVDIVTDGIYAYWQNPSFTIHGDALHKYCDLTEGADGETVHATACKLKFVYTVTDKDGNIIEVKPAREIGLDFGDDTTTEWWGFKLDRTGKFTIKVDIIETGAEADEDGTSKNFIDNGIETDDAYKVDFADSALGHIKNDKEIIDFTQGSYIASTIYVFAGTQYISLPSFEDLAITGYTFAGTWTLTEGGDTVFTVFEDGISGDTTLWAMWTINKYTITWSNYDGTVIYTIAIDYLELPVYDQNNYGIPAKPATDEYQYKWEGLWSTEINGESVELAEVTDHITYYAFFTESGREYEIKFVWGVDGKFDGQIFTETFTAVFGTDLSEYLILDQVTWFRADVWYTDMEMKNPIATVPVAKDGITVYGSYMFDIGNGDVNADGAITTDDITLYRQWIVGGYKMEIIAEGSEWATVTAEGFTLVDEDGNPIKYFISRVADVNTDSSDDIRDITTIRMSLVGGYGYFVGEGVEAAKVSGQAVVTGSGTNPGIGEDDTPETEEIWVDFKFDNEVDGVGDGFTVIYFGNQASVTLDGTVGALKISPNGLPADVDTTSFKFTAKEQTDDGEWVDVEIDVYYLDGKIYVETFEFSNSFTWFITIDMDGDGDEYDYDQFAFHVSYTVPPIYDVLEQDGLEISSEEENYSDIAIDTTAGVNTVQIQLREDVRESVADITSSASAYNYTTEEYEDFTEYIVAYDSATGIITITLSETHLTGSNYDEMDIIFDLDGEGESFGEYTVSIYKA